MTAFTIDAENNITVFASLKEIQGTEEGTQTFTNQEELAALADKWPGGRLVEIWNSLPGVQPVERFTSRRVADLPKSLRLVHPRYSNGCSDLPDPLRSSAVSSFRLTFQRCYSSS
jgi:hypothetical protein